MAEYDRQRTEEDRGLARTLSRAWHFPVLLFWMVLTGHVVERPILTLGRHSQACWFDDRVGGALWGSVGCDALTAHLKLVEATRPPRPRRLSAAPARGTARLATAE